MCKRDNLKPIIYAIVDIRQSTALELARMLQTDIDTIKAALAEMPAAGFLLSESDSDTEDGDGVLSPIDCQCQIDSDTERAAAAIVKNFDAQLSYIDSTRQSDTGVIVIVIYRVANVENE